MERATLFILTMHVLIFDFSSGEEMKVHRRSVNVSVGQPILLQTSYTLSNHFLSYVIEWTMGNKTIIDYYADNSSIDRQGFPTWSTGETTIYPNYNGRVEFYPLNASLLLKNIQLEDAGTYTICFSNVRKEIQLWVKEIPSYLGGQVGRRWNITILALRTVLCFVPIASLAFITRY
ncbi:carcinoembryonic antigen-related cell adhesion molecule 3-like isoform X2 [Pelobates cultripes]|uniref:Carcinoembryonic antigen-related cell adhesion molecule 3-like isoform X2 n=1 Tax=Pelobates cultripes TaxID=61616 RepID=A0AAD1T733_PELCU|nr:carcinoembryonic antigen-related cell adhesion molecule 3-like isoform X2 [Pelobates cultripes]